MAYGFVHTKTLAHKQSTDDGEGASYLTFAGFFLWMSDIFSCLNKNSTPFSSRGKREGVFFFFLCFNVQAAIPNLELRNYDDRFLFLLFFLCVLELLFLLFCYLVFFYFFSCCVILLVNSLTVCMCVW